MAKINASYVSRVIRLTLLASDIVQAILDGRQPTEMTLAALIRSFPVKGSSNGRLIATPISKWSLGANPSLREG